MRPAIHIALVTALLSSPLIAEKPPRVLLLPLSSTFGVRADPIRHDTRFHKGIDIRAASGTPVVAAADGVVAFAGMRRGYGLTVEIMHPDNRSTKYAHLSRIVAVPGEEVGAARVIGFVGTTGRSTGPHLHFEYWIAGRAVDPALYFERSLIRAKQRRVGGAKEQQHLSAYARSLSEHLQRSPQVQNRIALGESF